MKHLGNYKKVDVKDFNYFYFYQFPMNCFKSFVQIQCELSAKLKQKCKWGKSNVDYFFKRDLKSTYNNPHYKTNTLA